MRGEKCPFAAARSAGADGRCPPPLTGGYRNSIQVLGGAVENGEKRRHFDRLALDYLKNDVPRGYDEADRDYLRVAIYG